jgi:eukaryotic-like serine/threonine-protein kinase
MAAKLARLTRVRDPSEGTGLLKVGDLLAGKYRVERILGEGGMGVVVAAHHELLDQNVAVKLLYQDVADREAQERLLLEARSAAKLQSEHVARVIDVDTGADGLPFIVMELLDGADLCQIADARGALPRWLVVDYMLQALEGLAHAHVRGIIHRDLKPSNLFLSNRPDGTQIIKILDFGISKSTESQGDRRALQLTGGRSVLGSPPYMSPEQVRAPKTVDHRTDLWSLGICMYELLTNAMPFGGDEIQETFAQILEKDPVPIRTLVTGVPEGLEQIVMRCLAKKREERFDDVGELAKALVPFGSGTWMQAADRVGATLSRPVEDMHSGARLKGQSAPSSLDRLAIPSAPGRRVDSVQPELHGTASTVAKRFTVFDDHSKRWVLAVVGLFSLVGLALIGLTVHRHRASEPAAEAPVAVAAPPVTSSATLDPPPPDNTVTIAPGILTSTPHMAGPETEAPVTAPVGTVIGASPTASTSKHPPRPVTGAPPPPPRKPPPPAAAASTQKPLPPGLPRSRD